MRRAASLAASAALLCGPAAGAAEPAEETPGTTSSVWTQSEDSYRAYRASLDAAGAAAEFAIDLVNFEGQGEASYAADFEGKPALLLGDGGGAAWEFEAPESGAYVLRLEGMAAEEGSGMLQIALAIDGASPFREAASIGLRRTFIHPDGIQANAAGNDVQPAPEEVRAWREYLLGDADGYADGGYLFYLEKGIHRLSLTGVRGKLAIASLSFGPQPEIPSYAEYRQEHTGLPAQAMDETDIRWVEGETPVSKSDTAILPTADRQSPDTFPQSPSYLRLNTIGGDSWKVVGGSITWELEAPKDGWYQIVPRFRQNLAEGIFTSRRLLLDGVLPFQEAASLRFSYGDGWQISGLAGDGEPYLFYLTQGMHTVTLEAVPGDTGTIVQTIEQSLNRLNEAYREIVQITGTSADANRDYRFEALIPEVIELFGSERDSLQREVDAIVEMAGVGGSYTSVIRKLIAQLDGMNRHPETIAKQLSRFKSNLGSLGTWLLTATEQPLQIDRIYLVPEGAEAPRDASGFFGKLAFGIQTFLASFLVDYSTIGGSAQAGDGQILQVWMQTGQPQIGFNNQTGRDQAEILRQLIDSRFTAETGAAVQLQLVAPGTLLQSIVAGRGPDVVLGNASTEPIDYAVRHANVDLTVFEDFEEVAAYFHESALIPYTFMGKTYALPETFTFPMFFYRTDIFDKMGWEVPETWEDLLLLIPKLQSKSMTLGFPTGLTGFSLLLSQNGGDLYVGEGEKSNLNDNVCLDSFTEFTDLFTKYSLPVQYDFPNRFRSGEMPCGIQDYSLYNQLTVFAPEISGLWDFVPLPAKTGRDGTARGLSVGTGTNSMILAGAEDKELAWSFLKWWLGAETQTVFAQRMESVLGAAGKYMTANLEALQGLNWTYQEASHLMAQYEQVTALPEVPGSYYLTRTITFAFNNVYNNKAIPAEALSENVFSFNEEIARKRAEFGLETEGTAS